MPPPTQWSVERTTVPLAMPHRVALNACSLLFDLDENVGTDRRDAIRKEVGYLKLIQVELTEAAPRALACQQHGSAHGGGGAAGTGRHSGAPGGVRRPLGTVHAGTLGARTQRENHVTAHTWSPACTHATPCCHAALRSPPRDVMLHADTMHTMWCSALVPCGTAQPTRADAHHLDACGRHAHARSAPPRGAPARTRRFWQP
jgi:hypothetical protein